VPGPHRIFLLSPAHCGGKRASYLLNDAATFNVARAIRRPGGAPLADVFSFLSGLYFRGKVAYARAFARPSAGTEGALVITSNRGLLPLDTPLTVEALRAFGCVDIDAGDHRYREPLVRDARALATRLDRLTRWSCSAASRRASTSTSCSTRSATASASPPTSPAAVT
jgi:hypothetical protein